MKAIAYAAGLAVCAAGAAQANDYNFTVTNLMAEGTLMAPLIIVDANLAEPIMFDAGKPSEAFVTTILEGDPRPMNGKIGAGVAGPVLGKSGPPGVLIDGGETASTDLFIEASTLRFYAKASFSTGEDIVVSGVWDIAMGGGTLMLNSYDIGHDEGTNKVTLVEEGVARLEITAN